MSAQAAPLPVTEWRCLRCDRAVRLSRRSPVTVCPLCATPGPGAEVIASPRGGRIELVVLAIVVVALAAAWLTVWLHR